MTGIKPEANSDLPGSPTPQADSAGREPDDAGDHAKGRPHSDRHAAETLAGRLDKKGPAESKPEQADDR